MPLDGVEDIKAEIKSASDAVKKIAETTQAEVKNLGTVTGETKETADKLMLKHNELNARLTELEQATAGNRSGGDQRRKSLGERFTEDESVKSFLSGRQRGSVKVDVKAITSLTTDAMGSAGALVTPDRRPGILAEPDQRLFLRDLIAPGQTDSNAIEYVRETGFTNSAASVAELALKPESDLKFAMVTTGVSTIAHWLRASRQILADAAMLRSYIDQRLRYGLALEEEKQLLSGTGTDGDLTGILTVAATYAAPGGITIASPTRVDVLRLAALQAQLAEYPATGIVINPEDWAAIELTKTSDGAYLFANPTNLAGPRLWGLPVVATPAIDAGTFVTGSLRMAAQIFDRQDATIEVSTEDRDNFVRNAVTVLCEERLGFAIFRPEAIISGDFPA